MSNKFIEKVENSKIYDIVKHTPLIELQDLSKKLENQILLKREDMQPVFSFKCRGAHQKILSLSDTEKERGIIAASAGNHAQGVALSAKTLKLKATIVMPQTTPSIKINAVKKHKATVILYGDSYDEAYEHAKELEKQQKLTFIHPYDDEEVIIGQATVAKEILEDTTPDLVFIPVGGGGLAAGMARYLKEKNPKIKIITVEPKEAACLEVALKHNERVVLDQVGIFADGVAVKQIGKWPFEYLKKYNDYTLTVSTDEICAAIKDIFDETRSIAEPAGALALAGIKKYLKKHTLKNKKIIGILSGANTNFDRLRHIAERAEIGEEKEALFTVNIKEEKGSFQKFCKDMGKRSITEFNYRYTSAKSAHIFVGVELKSPRERKEILKNLKEKSYKTTDITDNECAKLHIRHIVGGKSKKKLSEKFFRIEFPERPGALMQFLNSIGSQWNITLFHYRNHGAAYGRVLVGLEIQTDSELEKVKTELEKLHYPFIDESQNKTLKLFI